VIVTEEKKGRGKVTLKITKQQLNKVTKHMAETGIFSFNLKLQLSASKRRKSLRRRKKTRKKKRKRRSLRLPLSLEG